MDRVKQGLSWVLQELDALLALVLAIAFAILGHLNVVNGDALTQATLAVLAVLALAILRERLSRRNLVTSANQVQKAVGRIEESVSSLLTGGQYHVLSYSAHWEIVTEDGAVAVGRKTKRLRFLRNNVISLYDYVQADGRISAETYSPGTRVDSFRAGARRYDLISLGRLMQAGEEIDFTIERTVHDSFLAARENVNVEVLDPTDVVVVTVTWPNARPPRNVRLEQIIDQQHTSRDIDSGEFQRRTDGRTDLSQTIQGPPVGSTISVVWDW